MLQLRKYTIKNTENRKFCEQFQVLMTCRPIMKTEQIYHNNNTYSTEKIFFLSKLSIFIKTWKYVAMSPTILELNWDELIYCIIYPILNVVHLTWIARQFTRKRNIYRKYFFHNFK